MDVLFGNSIAVFVGVTVIMIGFAAYMTGQAVANTWRPMWQVFVYCALLGLASRFLSFALFSGELLSWSGYLIDVVVLLIIAVFAFRLTRARKMVKQYPWMYERVGLFGWRDRQ